MIDPICIALLYYSVPLLGKKYPSTGMRGNILPIISARKQNYRYSSIVSSFLNTRVLLAWGHHLWRLTYHPPTNTRNLPVPPTVTLPHVIQALASKAKFHRVRIPRPPVRQPKSANPPCPIHPTNQLTIHRSIHPSPSPRKKAPHHNSGLRPSLSTTLSRQFFPEAVLHNRFPEGCERTRWTKACGSFFRPFCLISTWQTTNLRESTISNSSGRNF